MIIGALSQAFLKKDVNHLELQCTPLSFEVLALAHACGKNYFCIEDKGLIKTSLLHQRGPTKGSGYPLYKRSWPPLGLKMLSLPSTVRLDQWFPNICWEQPEATLDISFLRYFRPETFDSLSPIYVSFLRISSSYLPPQAAPTIYRSRSDLNEQPELIKPLEMGQT